MSSEKYVRIIFTDRLRFPGEGSSALGKSGPKTRQKCVADGKQVEIPVLRYNRTVGTHVQSGSRERKDRCKHRSCKGGKSPLQSEDVMWTELSVGKYVSHVPGKAAIVHTAPVP